MAVDFTRLFEPQSIAVLGASPVMVPGRFNHVVWLSASGFTGPIYPVNPGHQEINGYKCYPSLKDIPGEVDIAIMTVPAKASVEVLKDTPPGKVKFVVVITSGYGEIGEAELERELVETARSRGMRIVGPNCMGVYSRKGKLPQVPNQPFGPDPGEIATMGQSGGNAVSFVRISANSGVTVNCSVSIGNQCDLCMEDFLEWFDKDDDIKLIGAYVEDFKDGRRLSEIARKMSVRKPIILWKGGTTPQGSQAAASHTGALAIPREVWEGMVRQTGIIPADNFYDIINFSRALLWESLPQGPGVCLMSPGGGCSVSLTDCSIQAGLEVPVLSPSIREELSNLIAKVNTIIDNPIDLGAASYVPQTIKDTISAVSKEDAIHSFILYHHVYPFKNHGPRELSNDILEALSEVRQTIDKPIYVAFYSPFGDIPEADEARREAIEILNGLKIPYAVNLQSCIRIVSRIWGYSSYLRGRKGENTPF